MEALLQTLLRPEEGSPKAPPQVGGAAAESSLPADVPTFAAELLAAAGLAATSASQKANTLRNGPQPGGAGGVAVLQPFPGQAGQASRGATTDGGPGDPLAAGVAAQPFPAAGQGPLIVGGTKDIGASIAATPTAGATAATPAVPAATEASSGLTQPATPASAAAQSAAAQPIPALPADGAVSPAGSGIGEDATALAPAHGREDASLGQAVSAIASTTKGSSELPGALHSAMETLRQPQPPSPVAAPIQPDGAQGGSATATSAATQGGPAVFAGTSKVQSTQPGGQSGAQSATQGQPRLAADTATLLMNTAAGGGETAAPQGEPMGGPNAAFALGQAAFAAGDAGPEIAGRSVVLNQPALDQVAMAIQKAHGGGREQISLRLYPAELGRIDIHLELADDGILRASIFAEKADTLELLQRDSGALERALQNAGLKTDSGSLAFDLKNGQREGEPASDDAGGTTPDGNPDQSDEASLEFAGDRRSLHYGLLDMSV